MKITNLLIENLRHYRHILTETKLNDLDMPEVIAHILCFFAFDQTPKGHSRRCRLVR